MVGAEDGHLGDGVEKVLEVELVVQPLGVILEHDGVHDDDVFQIGRLLQLQDGVVLEQDDVGQDGALVEQVQEPKGAQSPGKQVNSLKPGLIYQYFPS